VSDPKQVQRVIEETDFGKNSPGNQRVRQQQRQGSPIPADTPELVPEKILAAALHKPDEQYIDR